MPELPLYQVRMRYGLYDPQDQSPICYCARCQGEIYYGNICFPAYGEQVLCQECYEEMRELTGRFAYAGDDDTYGIYIKE